jgi:hypothetical protein
MSRNANRLRHIPILDVAGCLAIPLRRTGNTWCMRESAQTNAVTSLCIFPKTNSWKRFSGKAFGGTSAGGPIDLCMHVREYTFCEALEFLATHFPNYQ